MESNSLRNRINLSPEAAEALLEQAPGAALRSRGLLEVKGKARVVVCGVVRGCAGCAAHSSAARPSVRPQGTMEMFFLADDPEAREACLRMRYAGADAWGEGEGDGEREGEEEDGEWGAGASGSLSSPSEAEEGEGDVEAPRRR